MKEMKNKSSVYIFPIIFYKLLEEGTDENIINHIHDTYLTDENDNFIIILDRINSVNGSELEEEQIGLLLNSSIVAERDYEELDDNLISIKIRKYEGIEDLIFKFTEGLYSTFDNNHITSILDFSFNYCTINFFIKVGYVLFKNAQYREFLAEEYGMDLKDFPEDSELDDIVNLTEEFYDRATEEKIKESYSEIQ